MISYPIVAGDGDPRHGTTNGYSNHLCRCPLCLAAEREYNVGWRSRVAGSLPPDDKRHGTASAYNNFKCRCQKCREAHRLEYLAYRTRKMERKGK